MTLFKYSRYGKEKDNSTIKELYYEGKFTLMFSVEYAEFDIVNADGASEKKLRCKIKMFAKEAETKYNVSKVKSVLDVDVTNLSKNITKQPLSIVI